MKFVLHPLSHYNSITEPRAQFLLSLIEELTIDFPSHFILSLIDVYKDTVTRDKLIFPFAITRIICHAFVSYLKFAHFFIWVQLMARPLDRVRHSFNWSGHEPRRRLLQPLPLHPPPLLFLPRVVWLLRPSWLNLSTWMLALTLSVMSCVRWTPVLVVSHNNRLSWMVSPCLHLHLHQLQRMRAMMMAPVMMMMLMRMMVLALPVTRRWLLLNDLPFVICDKKGK